MVSLIREGFFSWPQNLIVLCNERSSDPLLQGGQPLATISDLFLLHEERWSFSYPGFVLRAMTRRSFSFPLFRGKEAALRGVSGSQYT